MRQFQSLLCRRLVRTATWSLAAFGLQFTTPGLAADAAWVDSLSVVAVQELHNGVKPNAVVMASSPNLYKGYKLPDHERVLTARKKFPKDEFGAKDYLGFYTKFYEQEKQRLDGAKSFLLPAEVSLGSYNFEIGAYVPKISIRNVRGNGDYLCGAYDSKGSKGILSCLRVTNLGGSQSPFALLEMDEETGTVIRRSKLGFTLHVVPVENKFSTLDVDVKSVGYVGAVMKVQAVELVIYDAGTQKVLYRRGAAPAEGDDKKVKASKVPDELPPIESKVELELPGTAK